MPPAGSATVLNDHVTGAAMATPAVDWAVREALKVDPNSSGSAGVNVAVRLFAS